MPIVPLKNEIVFGMDSGIARGGIGVFRPSRGEWRFTFLRWRNKLVKFAQISNLKLLDNGIWITALGVPQAITVSRNLENWYPLYIEGISEKFSYHVTVSEGGEMVACSTGDSLLMFNKIELNRAFDAEPVMLRYNAFIDKLKGAGFIFKHTLQMYIS